MFDDDLCQTCGGIMEWETCYACFGDGLVEMEDDSYSDLDRREWCPVCSGDGGWWVCNRAQRHGDGRYEVEHD